MLVELESGSTGWGGKRERKQIQDYRIIHTNSSFDSKKVRSLQFVLFPNNHSVALRYAALHCVVVCKKNNTTGVADDPKIAESSTKIAPFFSHTNYSVNNYLHPHTGTRGNETGESLLVARFHHC